MINRKIGQYAKLLNELDLPVSASYASDLIKAMSEATPLNEGYVFRGQNRDNLTAALRGLGDSLGREMGTKMFFVLPHTKVQFYVQNAPLFGPEVSECFPGAISEDIAEAGKCFALGRYTSTVFHLMRAMEGGVTGIAKKLDATTVDQHGGQLTWGQIIGNMNAKLNVFPKGEEKNKLSEIVALLTRVKDAWRNDTMHPKQTYTEDEAKEILESAKAFMRRIVPFV
jgi:HEPN domain-containing protein